VLPVLLLREAYQPLTRPDARAALRNAMRLSFAGLFLGLLTPAPLKAGVALALLSGPFSLLLCGLRTGLILSMDRCEANLPESMALAELRAIATVSGRGCASGGAWKWWRWGWAPFAGRR